MANEQLKVQAPRTGSELPFDDDWRLSDEGMLDGSGLRGDFSGQSGVGSEIRQSRVSNARFTAAVLVRSHLTDVAFHNCDLSAVDLDEAVLTRVSFRDCRLSGVTLSRTSLRDVSFSDCRMDEANFRMTDARQVAFDDVDLRDADFYSASFAQAAFSNCDLSRAEFSKASVPGVRFASSTLVDLKGAQHLTGAVLGSDQVLPVALGLLAALGITVDDDRVSRGDRPKFRAGPSRWSGPASIR